MLVVLRVCLYLLRLFNFLFFCCCVSLCVFCCRFLFFFNVPLCFSLGCCFLLGVCFLLEVRGCVFLFVRVWFSYCCLIGWFATLRLCVLVLVSFCLCG